MSTGKVVPHVNKHKQAWLVLDVFLFFIEFSLVDHVIGHCLRPAAYFEPETKCIGV